MRLVLFVLRLLSLWQPHHIITGTRSFNWICQILIDVNDPQNAQNINKQILIKGENKAVLTGSRGVGAVGAALGMLETVFKKVLNNMNFS